MLEPPPELHAQIIAAALRDAYGLAAARVDFLPLGADVATAVYRVTANGTDYFAKARRGELAALAVELPHVLRASGIVAAIAPLPTLSAHLCAGVGAYTLSLYPFVAGRSGSEVELTAQHWRDLGHAVRQLHSLALPEAVHARLPRERYAAETRQRVSAYVHGTATTHADDAVAMQVRALLHDRRDALLDLVARTGQLATTLATQPGELVLCHGDLHAGNILVGTNGALYIVDWDTAVLARREQDLMFIGGGMGYPGHDATAQQQLFHAGYGTLRIDARALAYYRYERILQDVAAYCAELLTDNAGGADRQRSLHYLRNNFVPNGALDAAQQADSGAGFAPREDG